MKRHPRNSLWITSSPLPNAQDQALACMFDLIERYQCGGDLREETDWGLVHLIQEIALDFAPEKFDLAPPNDLTALKESVGKYVVELESLELSEADWDNIIAQTTQSGFIAFDERNRIFYRPTGDQRG